MHTYKTTVLRNGLISRKISNLLSSFAHFISYIIFLLINFYKENFFSGFLSDINIMYCYLICISYDTTIFFGSVNFSRGIMEVLFAARRE